MSKKVYHLGTCKTCQRILGEINTEGLEMQDVKTTPLTEEQVDAMAQLAGSYEAIFTRRSRQYRALGLHEQELSEADYRKYLLEHYTFLKRPVFVIEDEIFVGNAKKNVEAVKEKLGAAP